MAGGRRTQTLDDSTFASDPGRLRVSHAKLRRLRPDLYGFSGLLKKFADGGRERRHIAEQLLHGDSRAAAVVSTSPLLIAAYSDELDCVAMLRFPDELAEDFRLSCGTRLLTVNTYLRQPQVQADLIPGPREAGRWTGFHPIIAEFVSDDRERIEERKRSIGEAEWHHAGSLGQAYLTRKPGVFRDGRPIYAGVAGPKSVEED